MAEKIALIFTQQFVMQQVEQALQLQPQNQGESIDQYGMVVKQAQNFCYTFFRHPHTELVFDVMDYMVEHYDCRRALLVSKNMNPNMDVPPGRLKPNYYLIQTCMDLEECLQVEIPAQRKRQLVQRALPLTKRPELQQILLAEPMVMMAPQNLASQNLEPIRQPIDTKWQERLEAQSPADNGGQTCVICMDAAPTVMLAPCQHQCLCAVCVVEVMERSDQKKQCPVCRADIRDIFKPIK